MGYPKCCCCCLRIVAIFLALASCILVSNAIRASGEIESEKSNGQAEVIALPIQEWLPRASSGDGKKLLEVREVIGTIKAEYPGSEVKGRPAATPRKG